MSYFEFFNRGFLVALVEVAENEFTLVIEEEIQRRIKEQDTQDRQDNMHKTSKPYKRQDETDEISQGSDTEEQYNDEDFETNGKQNGHENLNGTSNGHHHENGQIENGNGTAIEHKA